MKYKHLFFDLDHTLWDFEANSRQTLEELYQKMGLQARGIHDFDLFHKNYLAVSCHLSPARPVEGREPILGG